jgi:membrane-bound metal-dependent hydrolase YbcI (DUF457 family)
MMQPTHIASGAASGAWLAVAVHPSPPVALVGAALAAAGAATPDLDHTNSSPVRVLGPLGWLVSRVIRLVSLVMTGRKHRGISHSLAFAVVEGCLVALAAHHWLPAVLAVYLGASAGLGVVSALLGDLVTEASLQHLFWPFPGTIDVPKRWRMKTGKTVERWVVFPAAAVLAVVGVAQVVAGG